MLNRRSFIAYMVAIGLFPVLPAFARKWADDLFLPSGLKLKGFKGQLIATTRENLWFDSQRSIDSFDWVEAPPSDGTISDEFLWAAVKARQGLGIELSDWDAEILNGARAI